MKKIGILGGTFDPVHIGHMHIAKEVQKALALDEIVFMVSGTPHYKVGERTVSSKEDRIRMTELSVADQPCFRVSDMECRREGNTYTADTLAELKSADPGSRYYLILGADAFFHMPHWYRIESVLQNTAVALVKRGEKPVETEAGNAYDETEERILRTAKELTGKYGAEIVFVETEPVAVSSTQVREWVKLGKDISGLVSEKVAAYISENGLYRED